MGGLNFIGSNNDDADEKESQRYDFDYTDPEKDKSNTGRLKPRASFFGRHKKSNTSAVEEPKKVSEAKFVDKQQVRKGKYKPTNTKYEPQKVGSQSSSAPAAVYAPTRSTTQSSIQPTFAQVNRTGNSTEPISQTPMPASQSVQPPVAPVGSTISPNQGQALNQMSSYSQSPPTAPQKSSAGIPPITALNTPVQPASSATATIPQPTVFPAVSNTTVSPTKNPTTTKNPLSKAQPVMSSGERPRNIPTPPPPPVHAAPMPMSAKTTTIAAPAMRDMQQSGHQKMYDTGTQVHQDFILQPIVTPTPTPTVQTPELQPLQNPDLPHLPSVSSQPVQQPIEQIVPKIPAAPAPPVHESVVPTPPIVSPAAPATQRVQPTGLPRSASTHIESGMPASAHNANTHMPQIGTVFAQNVESIHGEKTNPELISGKFLAVNLLPADFLKDLTPASKIVGLIKVALISCTVLGVIYGIMVGYQSYFIIQTKNNQLEINRLETEILTYAPLQNDINSTNVQLQSVSTLLARHLYWSNVFAMLEKYTLPNVTYQNFSGSTSGLITLQALTTDFSSISQQIHILNDEAPFVQSATSTSASRSDVVVEEGAESPIESTDNSSDIVAFTINLHLDPAIFLYQANANLNGNN